MVEDELSVARLGVMAALGAGDTGLAYRLVLGLMDDGHPFPEVLEHVLAPIQTEAGRRWELGDARISDEHASTAAVETVVALLAGSFEQSPEDRLVVVVSAEGETHTLPARMAAALLAYEGSSTIFLGSSLPASDLADYLATTEPDALVVSCTRAAHLPGARACIDAGHAAGVPVVVGGRAFGDHGERAAALGADAYAPTLSALVEIVERVELDPVRTESPSAAPLDASIPDPSTRAAAVARLVADLSGGPNASAASTRILAECAEDLVDTLVAAVSLQDALLLADHAVWLARILGRQTDRPVDPASLLAQLDAAVADSVPGAGALIADSITALTGR